MISSRHYVQSCFFFLKSKTPNSLWVIVKSLTPNVIWKKLSKTKYRFLTLRYSERKVRSINPIKGGVFLIRRQPPGAGLFSNMNHVLQGIVRSRELGLRPVVDMQNYWTWYSNPKVFLNTLNSWEYFFRPMSDLKIIDISEDLGLVLSKGNRILGNHWLASRGLEFVNDRAKIEFLHNIWVQEIHFNDFVCKILDAVKESISWDPDLSLGVSYRGTEYIEVKPPGHAIQPTENDYLTYLFGEHHWKTFRKIFLSSEDSVFRRKIVEFDHWDIYPDFRNSQWFHKTVEQFSECEDLDSTFVHTLGYLIEIVLLSECNSLIASVANGSAAALIMNGNRYKNIHIFDLGVY